MFGFTAKTAVVTGCSQGIDLAVVLMLAAGGARVLFRGRENWEQALRDVPVMVI